MTSIGRSSHQIFSGFLIDLSKIDKDDQRAILSFDRSLPLSNVEKDYIDTLYENNIASTLVIEEMLLKYGKRMSKDIREQASAVIDNNKLLYPVLSDDIGRGYTLRKDK